MTRSASMLLRMVLPALAGVGVGMISDDGKAEKEPAVVPAAREIHADPLPDDPVIIRLAALAGRTGEAVARARSLLAGGSSDKEIAEWLAPSLVTDPGLLELFLKDVPQERRSALIREVFTTLGNLDPESVWEVIRRSPQAVVAARSDDGTPNRRGLDLLRVYARASNTAEVMLDPSLGFTDDELDSLFRHGGASRTPNAERILEAWSAGRWPGDPPQSVRESWYALHWQKPGILTTIRSNVPVSLRHLAEEFEASTRLADRDKDGHGIAPVPSVEALVALGNEGVASLVEEHAWAAKPVPLEVLAQLPAEVRAKAVADYFDCLFPFSEAVALEAVRRIDSLDFTEAERGTLYESAAYRECFERGDFDSAISLAGRIPDKAKRAEIERDLWQMRATEDPEAALKHAAALPAGKLRSDVEALARKSMP